MSTPRPQAVGEMGTTASPFLEGFGPEMGITVLMRMLRLGELYVDTRARGKVRGAMHGEQL